VYGHHAILVGHTKIIRPKIIMAKINRTKIIRRRRDTHQPWRTGREHFQRLDAHRGLRAVAADEPVDLAVREDERRIARFCTRRPFRADHGRPDKGRATRGERRSPSRKV
jgi:hypothetical protein